MSVPIIFTQDEVATYYVTRMPDVRQEGNLWQGTCPFHKGGNGDFQVEPATGRASCSPCGRAWDLIQLEQALTGADLAPARERVLTVIGRLAGEVPFEADVPKIPPARANDSEIGVGGIITEPQPNGDGYVRNSKGEIRPLLANVVLMLRTLWPGVLGYDQFNLGVTPLKNPPALAEERPWTGAQVGEKWTDHDDRLAAIWIQSHGIAASDNLVGRAIQIVGRDEPYHPVREYLEALGWDGSNRLDTWLTIYLGAESDPYVQAVGSRFLISLAARVFQPGCKADCCLILEGPQGQGKSTALRTLSEPWFTDHVSTLGTKDSELQVQGVWLVELSELDAMSKAGASKVKSFLSRTADRFRPPYGRQVIKAPRQCIFAGTVNHSGYLQDQTGNRRFWPVACGRIDLEALARDRNQLLAEAVVRYRAGDVWWLETDELRSAAATAQEERLEGDPWDAPICSLLVAMEREAAEAGRVAQITVAQTLIRGVSLSVDRQTRAHEMRAASILRRAGWVRRRSEKLADGSRPWVYRPRD